MLKNARSVRITQTILLSMTLLLTLFLSYYNYGNQGLGNLYYTSAVKSMLTSFHNFFFVSFDPGGFISVDKPPVALWVEAGFVKLFGLHTWSLMLPEALAAVLSVAVIYRIVKNQFGFAAGITAAVALACTPVFIADARSNNPDAVLVLVMLLSAWAFATAMQTGRLRWLVLAAALVGVGFNTKMLVAFLIVPVYVIVYLLRGLRLSRKLLHLALAAAVLAVVSFSWITAVDLTPAAARPYVGSSVANSEYNLAFGYNGLNRVFPAMGSHKGTVARPEETAIRRPPVKSDSGTHPTAASQQNPTGIFRMFNAACDGQIGWMIPFALIGMIAAAFFIGSRLRTERRQKYLSLLLWAGWFLILTVFFSYYKNLTHRYYLNILAPGIAALTGVGLSAMWKLYARRGVIAFFLPAALAGTAFVQLCLLARYPTWDKLLFPPLFLCVAGAAALTVLRLVKRPVPPRLAAALTVVCFAALLFAPAVWSFTTVIDRVGAGDAYAGPELAVRTGGTTAMPDMKTVFARLRLNGKDPKTSAYYAKLSAYLIKNQGHAKYLAASPSTGTAENIILATGRPIMTIGGFSGSNPVLTLAGFQGMVRSGQVHYFLDDKSVKGGPNAAIIEWAVKNGREVSAVRYEGSVKNYKALTLYEFVAYRQTRQTTPKTTGAKTVSLKYNTAVWGTIKSAGLLIGTGAPRRPGHAALSL